MDDVVRQRLKAEVDLVARLRFAIDELAGRVERLEQRVHGLDGKKTRRGTTRATRRNGGRAQG